MADADDEKLVQVQDANSNLVCTGYLSDHDSKPGSCTSPLSDPNCQKSMVDVEVEESGEYITLTPLNIRSSVTARQLSQQLSHIQELEFPSETVSRNEFVVPTHPAPHMRHSNGDQVHDVYLREDLRSPSFLDFHHAMQMRSPDEGHVIRMNPHITNVHSISPDMHLRESPGQTHQFINMRESPILHYEMTPSPVQHMTQCPVNVQVHRDGSSPILEIPISPDSPRVIGQIERAPREFSSSPELVQTPTKRYPVIHGQLQSPSQPIHPQSQEWMEVPVPRHLAVSLANQQQSRDNHVTQSIPNPSPTVTETSEVTSVTSSTELGTTRRVTSRRVVTSVKGQGQIQGNGQGQGQQQLQICQGQGQGPGQASPSTSPPPEGQLSASGAQARAVKPSALSADGLTHNELVCLERAYHESPYPSYQQLGKKLGITPFKVKCWFRKRRRNLHQESGAEMSVEEETRVFKQFIDDHAAGRTIPSVILPPNGRGLNPAALLVPRPGPSTATSTADSGTEKDPAQQTMMAIPNPAMMLPHLLNGKRPRDAIKEPKVATVRPSKPKAKKPRQEAPLRSKAPTLPTLPPTVPIMQPVFPGMPVPSLASPLHALRTTPPARMPVSKTQMTTPDTTTTIKRECTTPSPSPSPALSTHSDSAPSPEQPTPLVFKNPQITELMQEREYLGRLLHEQQMQALETRKKLIDVDRELARVSAQLQAQYPLQSPEHWAYMAAAAHPQLMMIAQAQQQLLHAQNLAVMETQATYLNHVGPPLLPPGFVPQGQGQGQVRLMNEGQGRDSRSTSSTPEPDGQSLLPNTDFGLSKSDGQSDESNI